MKTPEGITMDSERKSHVSGSAVGPFQSVKRLHIQRALYMSKGWGASQRGVADQGHGF